MNYETRSSVCWLVCIYGVEIMFWVMSQTPDVWCSSRTFPQTTSMVGLYRPQILEFLGIGI